MLKFYKFLLLVVISISSAYNMEEKRFINNNNIDLTDSNNENINSQLLQKETRRTNNNKRNKIGKNMKQYLNNENYNNLPYAQRETIKKKIRNTFKNALKRNGVSCLDTEYIMESIRITKKLPCIESMTLKGISKREAERILKQLETNKPLRNSMMRYLNLCSILDNMKTMESYRNNLINNLKKIGVSSEDAKNIADSIKKYRKLPNIQQLPNIQENRAAYARSQEYMTAYLQKLLKENSEEDKEIDNIEINPDNTNESRSSNDIVDTEANSHDSDNNNNAVNNNINIENSIENNNDNNMFNTSNNNLNQSPFNDNTFTSAFHNVFMNDNQMKLDEEEDNDDNARYYIQS